MGVALFNLTGEDVGNLLHRGADLLVAANGKTIESIGRVELLLRYKGRETMTPVIVCLEYEGILLSWFLCVELRIFSGSPLINPSINTIENLFAKPGIELGKTP